MPGGTFTTRIEAPIERVWAVVGDIDTHASWSPKPFEMEWTSPTHNAVGSTFRSVGSIPGNHHNGNQVEVVERTEPSRLVLHAHDELGVFVNTYDLRQVDAGATEVAYTIAFPELHGMPAMAAPVLFPLTGKPDIRKRLDLLKAKVEAGG